MRHLAPPAALLLLWSLGSWPAHAFEPYTHSFTGDQARADAADGFVTIRGRAYAVPAGVAAALRNHPAFYDAGVVGPDVLPDLVQGWYLVHTQGNDDTSRPEDSDNSGDTGEWLAHLLERAWRAQSDPRYPATERAQILAFSYGFLTHPAGDMWAHTLVNDFARGRWPTLDDVFANADNAVIPLRHKIVEAYIGDATFGFDGNPERRSGHTSDDITAERAFAAPHRFLFETFIDHPTLPGPARDRVSTPGDAFGDHGRGATLDFFLGLRLQLVALRDPSLVDPLRDSLDEFDETREAWDAAEDDCNFGASETEAGAIARDVLHDEVACPIALARLGVTAVIDSLGAFDALRRAALQEAARRVFHSYLDDWVRRIEAGLAAWSELSLAITRAQFDPQARRDLQDRRCFGFGDEVDPLRVDCEDAITKLDVLLEETEEFQNAHLLAMLGLPPFVGDVRRVTDEIREEVTARLAPLVVPFDPILAEFGEITAYAERQIRDAIRDVTGIDLEEAERFRNPTHWLIETDPVEVVFPVLGRQSVRLFEPGDHDHLDAILGLTGGHHVSFGIPFQGSSGLADDAEYDPEVFPPVANTITNAKLLLLDAAGLNRVLGDVLVELGVLREASSVVTYRDLATRPASLMLDSLAAGAPAPAESRPWWLRDINSDHAWRADAPETGLRSGGTGEFPPWESCVLRPAFRALYQDWEHGVETFPDLGDGVSPDPSDPEPPESELVISGDFFDDGTRRFVSRSSALSLVAEDVFADAALALRYRFYRDPADPGEWIPAAPGTSFSLQGPDGLYFVDFQGEDPCHTFVDENGDEPGDPLPPEPVHTEALLLGRFGSEGRDTLLGTRGDDVLVGLGGDDRLLGFAGDDLLQGAEGHDLLIGHEGDDLLLGHDGDDKLLGQRGDDVLEGGPGADALHGGPGSDLCDGGSGSDRGVRCELVPDAAGDAGKPGPGKSGRRGSPPGRRGHGPGVR